MYIGIDPSYTGTGIVALSGMGVLIDSVLISTPATHTWRERISRIRSIVESVQCFFLNLGQDPDVQVLEGYSYASIFQSHQLGELGYHFRRILSMSKNGFVVPPKTITKIVTGKGNLSKQQVADVIKEQLCLTFDNLNLSDACAAAMCGMAMFGCKVMTEVQRERAKTWHDKNTH